MTILHGDCLELLAKLPANFVDAIVTDPPYGLGFMGKDWDRIGAKRDGHSVLPGGGEKAMAWNPQAFQSWCSSWASEALRVLKPGGHMLCFGGTRTFHRLVSGIEDAGFEIRDTLMWVYGQGFPKSHDISKGIDKHLGAERGIIGPRHYLSSRGNHNMHDGWHRPWMDDPAAVRASMMETTPATPEAQQWNGWGSALKPAFEPILLCRKPLIGTLAENVLKHGVGGLNIDGCRVGTDSVGWGGAQGGSADPTQSQGRNYRLAAGEPRPVEGRWPANVIHDGSEEVEAAFAQFPINPAGHKKAPNSPANPKATSIFNIGVGDQGYGNFRYGDKGHSASRFFYCAKASKKDRCGSKHPTVKPIALLQYLITLITPPGGTVLDPFAGSGTTGQAASELGFDYILVEREPEYICDIERRLLMPELFRA